MPPKLRAAAQIHDIGCALNRFDMTGDDAELDDLTDEQLPIALAYTNHHPRLIEYLGRRNERSRNGK